MFRIKTIENIEVIFQQKARNQDINTSFDQNFKKGDKDSTLGHSSMEVVIVKKKYPRETDYSFIFNKIKRVFWKRN